MVEFQQCCPECPYHFILSTEIEKAQHPLSWIIFQTGFSPGHFCKQVSLQIQTKAEFALWQSEGVGRLNTSKYWLVIESSLAWENLLPRDLPTPKNSLQKLYIYLYYLYSSFIENRTEDLKRWTGLKLESFSTLHVSIEGKSNQFVLENRPKMFQRLNIWH